MQNLPLLKSLWLEYDVDMLLSCSSADLNKNATMPQPQKCNAIGLGLDPAEPQLSDWIHYSRTTAKHTMANAFKNGPQQHV